jgi:hypothetical protein
MPIRPPIRRARTTLRPTSPNLEPSHLIRTSSLRVKATTTTTTTTNTTTTTTSKQLSRANTIADVLSTNTDRQQHTTSMAMRRAGSAPQLLSPVEENVPSPCYNEMLYRNTITTAPSSSTFAVSPIQADFQFLERTYPEFKFKLWNNTPQRAAMSYQTNNTTKMKRVRSPLKKIRLKSSLSNTNLALALEQKSTVPSFSPTIHNLKKGSHPSPEKLQTRLQQERILLHLLPEDDSLVIEATQNVSKLKTLFPPKIVEDQIKKYGRKARKIQNTGARVKTKKRNLRRGLRRFKRQSKRFLKTFESMKKEHQQLSEDFNRVVVSRPGETVPPIDQTLLSEQEYDNILAGPTSSALTQGRLSRERLRSRSSSTGSRPVSSQSIRHATTRLTRAKEQLRTVIYHDDDTGSGARLLGRPMSRSQKIRLSGRNHRHDVGVGLRGSVAARQEDGITSTGVKYQRTVVNAFGTCIMMETQQVAPMNTSWLGLAPEIS